MNISLLPKIELHCHLDGVLSPGMARDIQQTEAFPIGPAELQRAYPVDSLDSFFNWWNVIALIKGSFTHFYPVLAHHLARLKAQNVTYAEIMLPFSCLGNDPAQAIAGLQAFRAWADQQQGETLQVEFLVAVGRNRSAQEMEARLECILALYQAGLIVGFALAGPEQGNPVHPFQRTFAQLHEAGLGIEIHAGEWCGPESVWDALQYGYPDRIGHGVSLFQDPRLVALFGERQLHIEMCPTSNVKTQSVARLEDHPVVKARELGLNFSLNTDDPGTFLCSLEGEYELLATAFGFDARDFARIYQNSWRARFASRRQPRASI